MTDVLSSPVFDLWGTINRFVAISPLSLFVSYFKLCPVCLSFVKILRAEVGQRLDKTPCALITSKFGWTGNMQRIIQSQTHSKTQDVQRE